MRLAVRYFSRLTTISVSLAAIACLCGCDIHLDVNNQGSQKNWLLLDQSSRFVAAKCQNTLATALNSFSGSPEGKPFIQQLAANFTNRAAVLGPVWPKPTPNGTDKTSPTGTEKSAPTAPIPPEPTLPPLDQPLKTADQLVTAWKWCAQQQLTASYRLARFAAFSNLTEKNDLPSGTGNILASNNLPEITKLAALLWATGVAQNQELTRFTQAITAKIGSLPAPVPPILHLQNSKWQPVTKLTTTQQEWLDLENIPQQLQQAVVAAQKQGVLGRDSAPGNAIRRIDALRLRLETVTAQSGSKEDKTKQLEVFSPLARRQIQQLVSQLGTDPREANYSGNLQLKYNNLADLKQQVFAQWFAVEYQLLLSSPQPQKLNLAGTAEELLNQLNGTSLATEALPGLKAQPASDAK